MMARVSDFLGMRLFGPAGRAARITALHWCKATWTLRFIEAVLEPDSGQAAIFVARGGFPVPDRWLVPGESLYAIKLCEQTAHLALSRCALYWATTAGSAWLLTDAELGYSACSMTQGIKTRVRVVDGMVGELVDAEIDTCDWQLTSLVIAVKHWYGARERSVPCAAVASFLPPEPLAELKSSGPAPVQPPCAAPGTRAKPPGRWAWSSDR